MPFGSDGAATAATALTTGGPFHLRLGLSFSKVDGVTVEPSISGGYTRQAVTLVATEDTVVDTVAHSFTFTVNKGVAAAWSIHKASGVCVMGGALANQVDLVGTLTFAAGDLACVME